MANRIIYGKPGGHASARRIDVNADLILRALGIKIQKLGDYYAGHGIIYGPVDKYDPIFEQKRENVELRSVAFRYRQKIHNLSSSMQNGTSKQFF